MMAGSRSRVGLLLALLAVTTSIEPLVPVMKVKAEAMPSIIEDASVVTEKVSSAFKKASEKAKDHLHDAVDVGQTVYGIWDDHHDDLQLPTPTPGAGGKARPVAVGVVNTWNPRFNINSPVSTGASCEGDACRLVGGAASVLGLGRTGTLARRFRTFSYELFSNRPGVVWLGSYGPALAQQRGIRIPTPLIVNTMYPDRYYVRIIRIQVGSQTLQIPRGALDIRQDDGTGGVYLSTTRQVGMVLNRQVYELLEAAFRNSFQASTTHAVDQLCYLPNNAKVPFPTITLIFDNNAVMALQPGGPVWYVGKDGARCLSVLPSPNGETVLGIRVQMDRLVTYQLQLGAGTVTF